MGSSFFEEYFQTISDRLNDTDSAALLEGVTLIEGAREAGRQSSLPATGERSDGEPRHR